MRTVLSISPITTQALFGRLEARSPDFGTHTNFRRATNPGSDLRSRTHVAAGTSRAGTHSTFRSIDEGQQAGGRP